MTSKTDTGLKICITSPRIVLDRSSMAIFGTVAVEKCFTENKDEAVVNLVPFHSLPLSQAKAKIHRIQCDLDRSTECLVHERLLRLHGNQNAPVSL